MQKIVANSDIAVKTSQKGLSELKELVKSLENGELKTYPLDTAMREFDKIIAKWKSKPPSVLSTICARSQSLSQKTVNKKPKTSKTN